MTLPLLAGVATYYVASEDGPVDNGMPPINAWTVTGGVVPTPLLNLGPSC